MVGKTGEEAEMYVFLDVIGLQDGGSDHRYHMQWNMEKNMVPKTAYSISESVSNPVTVEWVQ